MIEYPLPDVTIDAEGLLCPLPVLRARKRLMTMQKGEVLCLRASDAMAAIDLPHFCNQSGDLYIGMQAEGGIGIHYIRKG